MTHRLLAALTLPPLLCALASPALAQRPDPVDLPRLLQLGQVPPDAAVMILTADGRLARPSGQPAAPAEVLLRIDRDTPLSGVTKLLEQLHAGGTTTVRFVAALPDGTEGCFTLALPEADADTAPNMEVTMHRRRAGVPPTSVTPVLRRLREWNPDQALELRVAAPPDAPWGDVLPVLAAVAAAGVQAAVLDATDEVGGQRPAEVDGGLGALAGALGGAAADADEVRSNGAFALDLGPLPFVAISPRAVPQPRPTVLDRDSGFLESPSLAPERGLGGGAGGRYGGRGGRQGFGDQIDRALGWLVGLQLQNGAFPRADGEPDTGTTALVLLALLGNGNSLRTGRYRGAVARASGFLLDQQEEDGAFAADTADSLQVHALATYAMAETFGLSAMMLLRGSTSAGVRALGDALDKDGGLSPSPGAAAAVTTTALAHIAIGSAKFFGITPPREPADLVAWFDRIDPATAAFGDVAATTFCRMFAGTADRAEANRAGDQIGRTADLTSPWATYWTSYALFQVGGRNWRDWSQQLQSLASEQVERGDAAGSWEPRGGLSRATTTALHTLTLQSLHRYTRLIR